MYRRKGEWEIGAEEKWNQKSQNMSSASTCISSDRLADWNGREAKQNSWKLKQAQRPTSIISTTLRVVGGRQMRNRLILSERHRFALGHYNRLEALPVFKLPPLAVDVLVLRSICRRWKCERKWRQFFCGISWPAEIDGACWWLISGDALGTECSR